MVSTTDAADDYEPTGDPEHVAYGQAYYWECPCGSGSHFLMGRRKAQSQAEEHERYCEAEPVIEVA